MVKKVESSKVKYLIKLSIYSRMKEKFDKFEKVSRKPNNTVNSRLSEVISVWTILKNKKTLTKPTLGTEITNNC